MDSVNLKDTITVRKGEELNLSKLETFLRDQWNDLPQEPLYVEQFPSGHSNLTYVLKMGEWEAVLRRPPLGPVAPKAHDMKREYTVLRSLHPAFNLAPKAYVYQDDPSIIGSTFFIMERRRGVVIDTDFPDGIADTPENSRSISETMVQTLATLHNLNYQNSELAQITKPDGFMERQVYGWIGRYDKAKTNEGDEVKEVTAWLKDHVPISPEPTVIHYDFKCNNAMFNPNNLSEMTGLFDWEMTTVGDPLADLGVALSYWVQEDDPALLKHGFGKPPITVNPGFYTRRQFADKYAEYTGRDVSDLHFYLTFAYFKLAVIAQQIFHRYTKGQTNDQRFAKFDRTVAALITHANNTARDGL